MSHFIQTSLIFLPNPKSEHLLLRDTYQVIVKNEPLISWGSQGKLASF